MQIIKVLDGRGYCRRTNSGHSGKDAGGGAGTIGGYGWEANGSNIYGSQVGDSRKGTNGTGGLLTIYANDMVNSGQLTSAGSRGGQNKIADHSTCGGSSGGGSINVFYKNNISGIYNATSVGGTGVTSTSAGGTSGAGGAGSVTFTKIAYSLNYEEKEIILNVGQNYDIDIGKLGYIKLGHSQHVLELGEIEFETLNEDIASIDENGKITGNSEGITKIKIKDLKNDTYTYVYLKVVNNVEIDVQEGANFTVALKQNGTVWSYGLNTQGQLGTGDNENKSKPVQIKGLQNIKAISVGMAHTLALTKDGKVYAWGQGTSGELGNGGKENSNAPVEVQGLTNIVKIDAYKNMSFAISEDGKLYAWGQGYSIIPMRIITSQSIVDISGTLMLSKEGKVYNLADTENPITELISIAKISCGTAHYLALDTNGKLYAWGTNTYGECETAGVAPKEIAQNIYEISAGNQISIVQKEDGKVYVFGNNANGQIGLNTTAKASTLTEITLTENVKVENISAGIGTHSGLVDENGYVWHTGTNTNGELGIGESAAQKVFTKTGDSEVRVNQDDTIYLDLNETRNIYSTLENTFNLKIDVIDNVQDNFSMTSPNQDIIDINGKDITAKEYRKNNINNKT